jgi:hypothetical protein
MRRVCLIGNSHLAAVKQGLDQARALGLLDGVACDTFGARWSSLTETRIEQGCLVPSSAAVARSFAWTSGGQDRIALGEYDMICLIAGHSPRGVLRYVPPGLLPPPGRALYRAVARGWAESWAARLGAAIAEATRAAVVFVGQPQPALQLARIGAFRGLLDASGAPDPAKCAPLEAIRAAIGEALAATPHPFAAIAAPPPACLDPLGIVTRAEFCRGAVRLTEGLAEAQPAEDRIHMNGAYGLELLRHLGIARG